MASSYVRHADSVTYVNRILARCLGFFTVAIIALALLNYQQHRHIKVDIQPGLNQRTTTAEGVMPDANVYSMALQVFQQTNRWANDGLKDCKPQINAYRAYMTDRYRGQALADCDLRLNRGELAFRTRAIALPPELSYSAERVKKVNETLWVVYLDLELTETVQGQTVKNPIVRYPIRVVPYDDDSEHNPYGLKLDGFDDSPRRLTVDELKQLGITRQETKP